MASRGPFSSKPSEIATAKAYLASRGLTVQQRPGTSAAGHAKQVQRIANQTYKQEQAGLAPNKQAARGHVTTPEHKGRAAPKLQPTKKAPGDTPACYPSAIVSQTGLSSFSSSGI